MDMIDCACMGKTLSKHIRPAVLAILASGPTHGYDIMRRLGEFELFSECSSPDASGVYRVLKSMELEGMVHSNWDLGDSGPARRRFSITGDGLDCLRHWVKTLERYRQGVGELLELVVQSLPESGS